jgi:hypothetical protein
VFVEGHPFRSTYDTWYRFADHIDGIDASDFIMGRWMDPHVHGYEHGGMRNFTAGVFTPDGQVDTEGVFTMYHQVRAHACARAPFVSPCVQLPQKTVGAGFDDDTARCYAQMAIQRLTKNIESFLQRFPHPAEDPEQQRERQWKIKGVVVNRFPFSIHQVGGHAALPC